MEISVREATIDEAAAIADVNIATWQAVYGAMVAADFLADVGSPEHRAQRERRWRERIADPASPVLVAVSGDAVAGYCCLAVPSHDEDASEEIAEIAAIYVAPISFRRGVGSQLMAQALELMTQAGYREVTLWVLTANDSARAFYTRHDFIADGAVKWIDDLRAEEMRMRRPL